MPVENRLTFAYTLSGLLAVLLIFSSVAGLLYGGRGLYDSYPASLAGLVGQDMVALGVVLPLLLVPYLRAVEEGRQKPTLPRNKRKGGLR